jgi:hypothetical protein
MRSLVARLLQRQFDLSPLLAHLHSLSLGRSMRRLDAERLLSLERFDADRLVDAQRPEPDATLRPMIDMRAAVLVSTGIAVAAE